jgi:hypothetical protein
MPPFRRIAFPATQRKFNGEEAERSSAGKIYRASTSAQEKSPPRSAAAT